MDALPVKDSPIERYDGFPLRIVDYAGLEYEKTGSTKDGRPVYCRLGDFERACRSFTNELLYVWCADFKIVPRDQYHPQ